MNKQKFLMASPAITWEHTPGSRRNSKKTMRLAAPWEMRPDAPALRAEQFLVPNQTGKEPSFAWQKYRESPRNPSQVKKNTDVTAVM